MNLVLEKGIVSFTILNDGMSDDFERDRVDFFEVGRFFVAIASFLAYSLLSTSMNKLNEKHKHYLGAELQRGARC